MSSPRVAAPNQRAQELYNIAMSILSGSFSGLNADPEELLQKATNLKHIPASVELAILLLEKDGGGIKSAVGYLQQALKNKYEPPLVNFYLGHCSHHGLGIEINWVDAEKYYTAAIAEIKELKKQNKSSERYNEIYIHALIACAEMHAKGINGKIDLDKAIILLSAAESAGSLNASFNLAVHLLQKSHDLPDNAQKKKLQALWLTKIKALATKRFVDAEYFLAVFHHPDKKVVDTELLIAEDDIEKSIELFWRAALGGKIQALYDLSHIYVDLNEFEQSNKIMALGAHMGHARCCLEYGLRLYLTDKTNSDNKLDGFRLIKNAADANDRDAQYEFAHICIEEFRLLAINDWEHTLYIQGMSYLRKAVANKNFLSFYELAVTLIEFPGENPLESYEEAKANIALLQKYPNTIPNMQILKNNALFLLEIIADNIKKLPIAEPVKLTNTSTQKNKPKKLIQNKPAISTPPNKNSSTYAALRKKDKSVNTELAPLPADQKSESKTSDKLPIPLSQLTDSPTIEPVKATVIVEPCTALQTTQKASNEYAVTCKLPKNLPTEAFYCLNKLTSQGYEAYVFGGLVRNYLCGKDSQKDDIDIVTNAPMKVIEETFGQLRNDKRPALCRFKYEKRICDITSSPELILLQKALQSDFTINTFFANEDCEVFDVTKRALNDLNDTACQLKALNSDRESYQSDPFRILRYLYFRASGFSGGIQRHDMIQYLWTLRQQFDTFRSIKPSNSDEVDSKATQAATFYEKFDGAICKFLMSGKANAAFRELYANDFFEIFFPGTTLYAETINWLMWRFYAIDASITNTGQSFTVTRNHIYALLLAAIINFSDNFHAELQHKLEIHPFPRNLRWKLSANEVLIWFNEKIAFAAVPAPLRNQLIVANFRATQAKPPQYAASNQEHYVSTQNSPIFPTATPAPTYFSSSMQQGYARYNHFNQSAQQITNQAPVQTTQFQQVYKHY